MREQESREIWSVSGVNRAARELLENGLPALWIEAEVSNLARPASGHLYFSLKDRNAQLRCAFFRQRQRGSQVAIENGSKVLVRGRLSLYEPRGDYQFIVESVEAAGEGELRRAFEVLKAKLLAEGLFDEAHKQPLPAMPKRIGVISSASGAALRDILHVLERRYPAADVLIYDSSVQGASAAKELLSALKLAIARADCDVLIMTRGGGSLEDLNAFNDEPLAREIYACPIPLISGVGHEIDFTIADFVADLRAPTPSAAAELATPDAVQLSARLAATQERGTSAVRRLMQREGQGLDYLRRRLTQQSPALRLSRQGQSAKTLAERLARAISQIVDKEQRHLHALSRNLNAVSPLATLSRGYAIVRNKNGEAITQVGAVQTAQSINVMLQDGEFEAKVSAIKPAKR